MTIFLKQSTAADVLIGPVTQSDLYTAQTSLTVTNVTMIKIAKEGDTTLTDITANTFSHVANGIYRQNLTTANTNTVGKLTYFMGSTSGIPVHREFFIVPANVYDSLVGTDKLDVNLAQISEDTTAADNLERMCEGAKPFTVGTGSSTSVIETDLTETTNDHYNGRTLMFTSGALAEQVGQITDYNGSTKQLTVSTLTEAPANGDTAVII